MWKAAVKIVGVTWPQHVSFTGHGQFDFTVDDHTAFFTRVGQEIIDGEIELTVAGETHVLGPGDAYYFDSRLPHRFRNTGKVAARIVSANSPPTF